MTNVNVINLQSTQRCAAQQGTKTHTHTQTQMQLLKHPCYSHLLEFVTMDFALDVCWCVRSVCLEVGGCRRVALRKLDLKKKQGKERKAAADRQREREIERMREREKNHCGTFDLPAASHNNDLFGPARLWSPETKAPAFVSFFLLFNVCRTKKIPHKLSTAHLRLYV